MVQYDTQWLLCICEVFVVIANATLIDMRCEICYQHTATFVDISYRQAQAKQGKDQQNIIMLRCCYFSSPVIFSAVSFSQRYLFLQTRDAALMVSVVVVGFVMFVRMAH